MERRSTPSKFSSAAITMFKKLMTLDPNSEEYERLDDKLGRELDLHPWQGMPTIVRKNEGSVHPSGTGGFIWDTIEGPALYRELCAATNIKP